LPFKCNLQRYNGGLTGAELRALISRAVPDVTPRELRHFAVLADAVGYGLYRSNAVA
jgi:hypothetical protein